jgi:signal transduction histidine kinase
MPLETLGDEILELVTTSLSQENLLSTLALKIATSFPSDACLLVTLAHSDCVSKTGYWSKSPEFSAPNISLYLKNIETTKQAQAINLNSEIREDDLGRQTLGQQLGWRGMLYINTYYQQEVNGFIALGYFEPQEWSLAIQEKINKLAMLLSLIFVQQQQQQQERKQDRYQTFLINLNREIERSSQMSSLWRLCLSGLGASLKVDQGLILKIKYLDPFLDFLAPTKIPQAEVAVMAQWSPEYPQKITAKTFLINNSILCQKAWFKSPNPLIVDNNLQLKSPEINQFRTNIFPNILVIPLLTSQIKFTSQQVILGFIVLQQREFRVWQSEEIRLIQAVSIQISMAIIQSQTLQQVQSLVKERTSQLKWSLDMQGKLYLQTKQQLEQLKRLDQVKDEFIARLSDELRLPLANMKMAMNMIKLIDKNEKLQKYSRILEIEYEKEVHLINDLLTIEKIKTAKLELYYKSIKLYQIVKEVSEIFRQQWQSKKLTLAVDYALDTQLLFYSDRESLLRIFDELLQNSGKFSVPETTVSLSINKIWIAQTPQIVIKVINFGRQISQQEKQHIFEPFYRGEDLNNGSSQGAGLGLYLVKSLVDYLNGKIEIDSQVTANNAVFLTSFTVTLPYLNELTLTR